MEYVWMKRVGEVEEEHSFTDLTIDEWLVIRGSLLKMLKEDSHTTTPNKGFDIAAALANCGGTTVYGGLEK